MHQLDVFLALALMTYICVCATGVAVWAGFALTKWFWLFVPPLIGLVALYVSDLLPWLFR